MNVLFPYSQVRKHQDKLIAAINHTLEKKKNLLIDAPTGLGKTAAALAPALSYALKNKLTVFFLTSRHTQHKIAIDTLRSIRERHSVEFTAVDIVGRKWMCLQPGVETFATADFNEFCKGLREEYACDYYVKTRKKTGVSTIEAENLISTSTEPLHTEEMVETCKDAGLCPYEIDLLMAKNAHVIIADYFHLFNPMVRDSFFRKIEKRLGEAIVIVDEAHNLPDRIRGLMTHTLSNAIIKQAVKEAKQFNTELIPHLSGVQDILNAYAADLKDAGEKRLQKELFRSAVGRVHDYDALIDLCEATADVVRDKKRTSFVASIATFLRAWQGPDEGFARILFTKPLKQPYIALSYRCLDPSLVSTEIADNAYATIMMSGTLRPTSMYKDILGFRDAVEQEFKNAFPRQNRLNLVVPTVTTKFSHRSKQQFAKIAKTSADIVEEVPGNVALFFPSYEIRDAVYGYFTEWCDKPVLLERPRLSTQEKSALLHDFKRHKENGAVLLGVIGASFSEGVDLPGDLLKGVVVVGLPLGPPDLETQELINYYDTKFGKGWDYAYVLPALTKTIQTAGRCIRSETDKGVVAFLDYRYALPQYKRCFPRDWDVEVTDEYEGLVREFFEKHS